MKLIATVEVSVKGVGDSTEFSLDFHSDTIPPLPSPEEYNDLVARGETDVEAARQATSAMIYSRLLSAVDREWFAIKSEMSKPMEVEALKCSSTPDILH